LVKYRLFSIITLYVKSLIKLGTPNTDLRSNNYAKRITNLKGYWAETLNIVITYENTRKLKFSAPNDPKTGHNSEIKR
jgi:hypothetical protein